MKKIIILLSIGTMVFCLTACGKSKEIELTLENYDDYLNIDVSGHASGDMYGVSQSVRLTDDYSALMFYGDIIGNAYVKGASTNFNYNDVKIKIKLSGEYESYKFDTYMLGTFAQSENGTYEMIFELDTNISGDSEQVSDDFSLPDGYVTHDYLLYNKNVEVIEISGTVTPVE